MATGLDMNTIGGMFTSGWLAIFKQTEIYFGLIRILHQIGTKQRGYQSITRESAGSCGRYFVSTGNRFFRCSSQPSLTVPVHFFVVNDGN